MVKKTNPSSDDISVFFDAAKGTMPKDHQDLKNNILRDAEKTNSELNTLDELSVFFEASKAGVPKVNRDLETRILRDADSCLLYTSPSPRDVEESRMPSSA